MLNTNINLGLDGAYGFEKYEKQMSLSFIDFGLFLSSLSFSIRYEPSSIAYVTPNEAYGDDFSDLDKKLFIARWNSLLKTKIEKDFLVSDLHFVFRLECGTSGSKNKILLFAFFVLIVFRFRIYYWII